MKKKNPKNPNPKNSGRGVFVRSEKGLKAWSVWKWEVVCNDDDDDDDEESGVSHYKYRDQMLLLFL